ncbi:ParB/Srx family N-terminal domain-containing protein [Ferrimonas gelatinilytica]|uniref:ParB/Sulfiredoxin domain-containing protein n=1 Tax=Ferrimonas gelatinilytica TaxID=1255257 RepID=A0ABP9S527_9GAMM
MSKPIIKDISPSVVTLDPKMQARDTSLINNKRDRQAQEVKQAKQDKELLEDIRNGHGIRQPIEVFEVGGKLYVVDGFHRTQAALNWNNENPEAPITLQAEVHPSKTYLQAFMRAQYVNQNHGVGVTHEEVFQSKFRALILDRQFKFSVSQLKKLLTCSQGQAAHARRALLACGEALAMFPAVGKEDVEGTVEALSDGLEMATPSMFDSQGFPKVRPLSNAVLGLQFSDLSDDELERKQRDIIQRNVAKMVDYYGADLFREALRRAVAGTGLGISVSKRDSWLAEEGNVSGSDAPDQELALEGLDDF